MRTRYISPNNPIKHYMLIQIDHGQCTIEFFWQENGKGDLFSNSYIVPRPYLSVMAETLLESGWVHYPYGNIMHENWLPKGSTW